MTSFLLIAFGFVLLVVEAAVATRVPIYGVAPNLVLPIAIYLGVSAEVELVRGALISFALGYLLDSFCGNPMGLQTFVLTASFMVARGAGLRLFPQGTLFQILLIFLMALAFSATVFALRAIFEQPQVPGLRTSAADTLSPLLWSAAATAFVSPAIFAVTRRIDSLGAPKREERTVSG
ncbi:MAG: rod shape-determining protein MreD [Polyangiales bacterium]